MATAGSSSSQVRRAVAAWCALVVAATWCAGCSTAGSSATAAPTTNASATASSTGSASTASPSADPLAAVTRPIDALGSRHLATIPIEGEPDWPLVAFGSVWVTNSGTGQVERFDPRTNTLVASVAITSPCNGLTSGAGSVWVGSCAQGGYVARIDAATNAIVKSRKVTLAPDGEGQLAFGSGSLWVATGDGQLLRLDPGLTTVQATIPLPTGASAAIFDPVGVWVTARDDGKLLRVDPARNAVVATYPTGGRPQFLASGFGAVWTLNQADGTVTRIDEKQGTVTTIRAESPGEGGFITSGLGAVWLTIYTKPLTRIDPATNQVTEQLTGPGGDGVITGFGSLWLTNNQIGSMYRIAPV
jgi:streptogramin lyase